MRQALSPCRKLNRASSGGCAVAGSINERRGREPRRRPANDSMQLPILLGAARACARPHHSGSQLMLGVRQQVDRLKAGRTMSDRSQWRIAGNSAETYGRARVGGVRTLGTARCCPGRPAARASACWTLHAATATAWSRRVSAQPGAVATLHRGYPLPCSSRTWSENLFETTVSSGLLIRTDGGGSRQGRFPDYEVLTPCGPVICEVKQIKSKRRKTKNMTGDW